MVQRPSTLCQPWACLLPSLVGQQCLPLVTTRAASEEVSITYGLLSGLVNASLGKKIKGANRDLMGFEGSKASDCYGERACPPCCLVIGQHIQQASI